MAREQERSFMLRHRYRIKGFQGLSCKVCGSPWHEETGSVDGPVCGACCRSFVQCLLQTTAKRLTGGVDFYIHAVPPKE